MDRTIHSEELRRSFDSFNEANAFWNTQMESIRGYKLRYASLDYAENFDTKVGKWSVFIRWFPIPADTELHTESLIYGTTS